MPAGSNGNNIGKSDSFSPPHRPSPRQLAALRRETQERLSLALENEDSYNDPNILRPRGTGCVPGRMDLGESPFGLSPDSMRKAKAQMARIRPPAERTAGCDACNGKHKAHTPWCKERLSMLGKPVKKSGPRKGEVLQYVQQAAVKRKLLLGTQNDEIESQSALEREPAAHGARSARSSNCSSTHRCDFFAPRQKPDCAPSAAAEEGNSSLLSSLGGTCVARQMEPPHKKPRVEAPAVVVAQRTASLSTVGSIGPLPDESASQVQHSGQTIHALVEENRKLHEKLQEMELAMSKSPDRVVDACRAASGSTGFSIGCSTEPTLPYPAPAGSASSASGSASSSVGSASSGVGGATDSSNSSAAAAAAVPPLPVCTETASKSVEAHFPYTTSLSGTARHVKTVGDLLKCGDKVSRFHLGRMAPVFDHVIKHNMGPRNAAIREQALARPLNASCFPVPCKQYSGGGAGANWNAKMPKPDDYAFAQSKLFLFDIVDTYGISLKCVGKCAETLASLGDAATMDDENKQKWLHKDKNDLARGEHLSAACWTHEADPSWGGGLSNAWYIPDQDTIFNFATARCRVCSDCGDKQHDMMPAVWKQLPEDIVQDLPFTCNTVDPQQQVQQCAIREMSECKGLWIRALRPVCVCLVIGSVL